MSVIISAFLFLLICCGSVCANNATDGDRDKFVTGIFPDGFLWGAGSSAFQIEGAWNTSGKGPSNWDVRTHANPAGQNADVACDSYNKYEDDVRILKEFGASAYKFSLSCELRSLGHFPLPRYR